MFQFGQVSTEEELKQILELQQLNLRSSLSPEEIADQGFVTLQHNLPLLRSMNDPYPHIIARHNDMVIGYALVMLPKFKTELPLLEALFDHLQNLNFNGNPLLESRFFIMGQVCVAKAHRGKGVLQGLYREMRKQLAPHFECTITEVGQHNPRSMRAHLKTGFRNIRSYRNQKGEDWSILLWDWSSA